MNKKLAIVLALALIAIVCCAGCIGTEEPVDPVDPVVPVDPVDPVTPPVDPVVPAEEYSVFFMLNYGEAGAYSAETVTAGDAVAKPTNPTRSGYTFKGWFTAAEGGAEYDFTLAVNADLTLYAQWKKKSSSSGGSSAPSHTHSYGDYVSNNDGTHTKSCSSGDSTVTENCKFSGFVCTLCNYEDSVYHISNQNELQAFAELVNGGESFSGKTVVLDADIDLGNAAWTPLGTAEKPFDGTFDGNGKTISNLKITGTENVGFFGVLYGTVKNLNINGAIITGNKNVGTIVGYGKSGSITGCTVTDATITVTPRTVGESFNDGDDVGGIVGFCYNGDDGDFDVIGCTVTDATITAFRDVGGIAGSANGDDVTGNTVFNVAIIVDKVTNAYDRADINGDAVLGRVLSGDLGTQTSVTDCTVTVILADGLTQSEDEDGNDVFTVSSGEGLVTLMEKNLLGSANVGDQALIFEDNAEIDMSEQIWTPIKVDGYHGADIMTINGNDATITGLTAPLFAGGFAGGSGIIINDLTIADSVITSANTQGIGAFVECADSMDKITLINCHLLNSKIIIDGESRVGGLVGWTAGYNNQNDGSVDSYITIEKCSVIGCELKAAGSVGGIVGHAGANAATFTTISDCIVKNNIFTSTDDGEWRVGVVVGTANNGQVEIEDITADNNTISQTGKTAPEGQSNLYGRFVPSGTGTLVIDDVEILSDGLSKDTDGNHIVSNTQGMSTFVSDVINGATEPVSLSISGAINLNSVTDFSTAVNGKDITLIGLGDGAEVTLANAITTSGSKLTFKGLTLKKESGNYKGFHHVSNEVYEGCIIEGEWWTYGPATFTHCIFKQTSSDSYNIWTYGSPEITFKDCVFESAGKSVLIYNEGATGTKATFDNCTFIASSPVSGKAAIEIDGSLLKDGKKHEIIIINHDDSKVTGFGTGSISGNSLWNDKKTTIGAGTGLNSCVSVNGENVLKSSSE